MTAPSEGDTAAQGAAWCVRLAAPAGALDLIEAALDGLGGALASEAPDAAGRVRLALYLARAPDRAAILARLAVAAAAAGIAPPEFAVERLAPTDWVAESRRALPAVRAGPFYIHGGHVAEAAPAGAIALRIEASLAFGTGRHESTRGCLLALAGLAGDRRVGRALDLGCGTGVLALAAARLWACPVLAVDNDPDAVRLAAENAAANGLGGLVEVALGEGYAAPALARAAPFDLIVANILAEPLCAMAPDLVRHLAPGGAAVLSGLLAEQEAPVLEAHAPLRLARRIALGEWVTLVLGRAPAAA